MGVFDAPLFFSSFFLEEKSQSPFHTELFGQRFFPASPKLTEARQETESVA